MTITLDTVFYAQIGGILVFLVTLFGLYRLLVGQKDATIEQLNERCNTLNSRIEMMSADRPDVLVERQTKRLEALTAELKHAAAQQSQDTKTIHRLEQQLSSAAAQFEMTSNSVDAAKMQITRYRRGNMRAALATLYSDRCQICGDVSDTQPHSCAIKPLAAGGAQSLTNYVQLCPNHHHLFDLGKFTISDDYKLIGIPGTLEMDSNHQLNLDSLHYHQQHVYKVT